MRLGIAGAASPHPIGHGLPALYLEDEFVQRFVSGLDEVLAPVLLTLDCLSAYLDPDTAPEDFLDWLTWWVAAPGASDQPVAARRQAVRQAIELHRWRGTPGGVAAEARLLTGGDVELIDSGGVTWSPTAGGELAGLAEPQVRVVVRAADPAALDHERITELIAQSVPAHVRLTVEVVGT